MISSIDAGISEQPDVHSSSAGYAARFDSATGAWFLAVQEEAVLRALPEGAATILDVGGGHGQITEPLLKSGKSLTVLGSAPLCSERIRRQIDNGLVSFQVGSLLNIPFSDRSFDYVVCLRIMSHTTNWRSLIAELCRVARIGVVVDFPVWSSVNFLTPLLFSFKRMAEGNTRTYRLFSHRSVKREFANHNFQERDCTKQFFYPLALHRILKAPTLSQRLESQVRNLGVTALFGSPLICSYYR